MGAYTVASNFPLDYVPAFSVKSRLEFLIYLYVDIFPFRLKSVLMTFVHIDTGRYDQHF